MEQQADTISPDQLVLCNGLILPKILTHLPFRQYLETRLISTLWDDAVRRTISSRARIDLSLCSIVKKADDKKKSEIEEKLDSIEFLKITELQIGIDDNLHPTIAQAFEEIGPSLTKLTVKINLEKGPDFSDFFTLLNNSPNLKELIWWGVINETHCHNYTKVFSSVKKLSLGFYQGEMQNMGKTAVLWVSSIFPNVSSLSCIPHHREGVMRHLLAVWGEGRSAFPLLTELTIHLMITEDERLTPLQNIPEGLKLKVLNLSIDGKRGTGSVQEFLEGDATILTNLLQRHTTTLEKVVLNFLNLWKPKPQVVLVSIPGMKSLKYLTVMSDFSGDISIDIKPQPGAYFPKLLKLSLPYLWGEAINRFLTSSEEWDAKELKSLDLKIKDKAGNAWIKKQGPEWSRNLEETFRNGFPTAELTDWSVLYKD